MLKQTTSAILMLCALTSAALAQTLPPDIQVRKDVTYATIGDKPLLLDVYSPAPKPPTDIRSPSPTLVRVAPTRETPVGAAADLLNKGYILIYAAYLPPESKGVFSQFPRDIQAAKAAIRWTRGNAQTLNADADRIGIWGSGHGASIAAIVAMTADQKPLNGTLGDFPNASSAVRAVCLFEGVTDWRNAELYGDETVNFPGSPAYQFFGGNPKEHPDDARQASAVNFVRPTSPATLMVTLAGDQDRAMHQIFAETLHRAGVPSALYEEQTVGDRLDESSLNRTVVAFCEDTLRGEKGTPKKMTLEEEIDTLTAGGLFKQARRLIDEKVVALPGDATLAQRTPWLNKLRAIDEKQQEPALRQLLAAKKSGIASAGMPTTLTPIQPASWTIREVLTDPERIGQYTVEAVVSQRTFDARANALHFVETLNALVLKGDTTEGGGGDREAAVMTDLARRGDADAAILNDCVARYHQIKGKTSHVWPSGIRGVPYANDYGQDLYGYWMDFKAGGITQRLRYIPPGKFTKGSSKDEWGRLPGEPILEPAEITKGFWLAESEVTQGLYEGVLGKDENHSAFRVTGNSAEVQLKLPVENISYAHAINFLNKLGIQARLPTDVEWEYACRANSPYMYGGTGRLSDMAWFWDEAKHAKDGATAAPAAPAVDATGAIDIRILHELETDRSDVARLTHPVKQKLPNRWGLYDMQGNVWEWCSGTSSDKPHDYHVAKGGSWLSIPPSCRAARDVWLPIEEQAWNVGMRICITAQ